MAHKRASSGLTRRESPRQGGTFPPTVRRICATTSTTAGPWRDPWVPEWGRSRASRLHERTGASAPRRTTARTGPPVSARSSSRTAARDGRSRPSSASPSSGPSRSIQGHAARSRGSGLARRSRWPLAETMLAVTSKKRSRRRCAGVRRRHRLLALLDVAQDAARVCDD